MAALTLPGVLVTGDHASRPAASAVAIGALYACSTHPLIYQSDGATWSTWATLGTTLDFGESGDIAAVAATAAAGASGEVADAAHAHVGVASVAKNGSTALVGAVTLTGGTNVTLTQTGNDISIAASGGGGGGLAQSFVGYNTAGGSAATPAGNNSAFAKKFTLGGTSHILSVGAYIAMASLAGTVPAVALYADSGGSPSGPPISVSSVGRPGETGLIWDTPTAPGWLDLPVAKTLAAGDYWALVTFLYQATSWRIYYDGSGSDKEVTFSDTGYIEGITYRASLASASRKYSIRVSILS